MRFNLTTQISKIVKDEKPLFVLNQALASENLRKGALDDVYS